MRLRKVLKYTFLVLLVLILLLPAGIYLGVGPALSCIFPSSGPVTIGLSTRVVLSNGAERCYLLYAPPGFNPDARAPLIFALHGLAGNPQGFRGMTGWEEIADRESFLVIYPHGSSFPLRWNTSPAFHIEETDDVRFIADILSDLSEIAAVDEDRVYVTGFSNGAGMTDLIACTLADRVAAVGLVEGKGEDDPSRCAPTRPVPVIAFFGTGDPLESAEYPIWFYDLMNLSSDPQYREGVPISTWLEGWVSRNGCDPRPRPLPDVGDATVKVYHGCADHADVVIYTIEGGGHSWPGGWNLPFFGKISTSVDASEIMWEFFEDHPRVDESTR